MKSHSDKVICNAVVGIDVSSKAHSMFMCAFALCAPVIWHAQVRARILLSHIIF